VTYLKVCWESNGGGGSGVVATGFPTAVEICEVSARLDPSLL